jgi:hypothetical protein
MKSITIAAHCYLPIGCDLYAEHLKWQMASIIYAKPQVQVTYTAFVNIEAVPRILPFWEIAQDAVDDIPNIQLGYMVLNLQDLLRRAIARNTAALHCTTDVLWLADLDYVVDTGCLEAICNQIAPTDGLRFPLDFLENIDHETGDKMIEDGRDDPLPRINPALFKPRRRRFAIGGLQMVGGDTARELGYLPNTKWTKPVTNEKGWRQTGEDVAFRRVFDGRGGSKSIDVPNLYWIRHAVKGADIDGQGNHVGKAAW